PGPPRRQEQIVDVAGRIFVHHPRRAVGRHVSERGAGRRGDAGKLFRLPGPPRRQDQVADLDDWVGAHPPPRAVRRTAAARGAERSGGALNGLVEYPGWHDALLEPLQLETAGTGSALRVLCGTPVERLVHRCSPIEKKGLETTDASDAKTRHHKPPEERVVRTSAQDEPTSAPSGTGARRGPCATAL